MGSIQRVEAVVSLTLQLPRKNTQSFIDITGSQKCGFHTPGLAEILSGYLKHENYFHNNIKMFAFPLAVMSLTTKQSPAGGTSIQEVPFEEVIILLDVHPWEHIFWMFYVKGSIHKVYLWEALVLFQFWATLIIFFKEHHVYWKELTDQQSLPRLQYEANFSKRIKWALPPPR